MIARPTNAPAADSRDGSIYSKQAVSGRIATVCVAAVLTAWPATAQLGVGDLFSDDLDSAMPDLAVGFHDERFGPGMNSAASDFDSFLGFGYSNFSLGQAAPGQASTGDGIVARVNQTQDFTTGQAERVALNYSPELTIDSATTDWVMTVNAFAISSFAGGETLGLLAGMHSNSTRVNWQGGTDTDGLFWSLTTDGRASNDLISFGGNPGAPPTAFAVQTIDGTPADVNFAEGLYEERWLTLAVGSHDNTPFFAVRTHEPDGFPNPWQVLESFDNTGGPTVGRPWFGVEDPFNSAGNAAVTFDNVSISTLRPGDTDWDGDVDFADAMALLANFSGDGVAADTGGAVAPGFDANLWLWTVGDFDQDRDVDFNDALQLVNNYSGAGNAIEAPGEQTPAGPATLVVDVTTGAVSIETESALAGVSIEGEALNGDATDAFGLALAAEADAYVGVALSEGFAGGDVGVSTGGVTDASAWSFAYGVSGHGEVFQGQVQFVPEPGLASGLLIGGMLLRRCSRRSQSRAA